MSNTESESNGRCIGRLCGEKFLPAYPGAKVFRYKETRCPAVCAPGDTMCKRCHKREEEAMGGKLGVYHGVMGGPLPNESHIRASSESKRSKWNVNKQLQEAAAHLKAAGAAGGAGDPAAVKKAATEAKRAEKEAAEALRAAAAAAKREEVELRRAATAAEKAVKAAAKAARASEAAGAVKRRTQRKKKSSSSSSSSGSSSGSNTSSYRSSSSRKSRRRASPIYRAASGQSMRGPAYVNRGAPGTPLRSENMGNANPETLERIMDNLAGLPELQRPLD